MQFLHACDGRDVTVLGRALDIVTGEAYVDVVAEDATAEHLAELVLGVHETLHGSLANPPCGIKTVSRST